MTSFYWFCWSLSKLIAKVGFSFEVVNQEKIIEDRGAILASNHQSFLDPPLIGISCRNDCCYLARKSLLKWPILGPLFPKMNVIPVDQTKADMSALKILIKKVREGKRAIIFPEGARTFDGNLQPGQPGIGLVVAKTMAPVVPMRIFGAFEAMPRTGGLKFRKIKVVVGDPITFTEEEIKAWGKDAYQNISRRVMEAIASIKDPNGK